MPTAIVRHLKRTDGMSVRELARTLGMSYMGVKKPCLDLTKQGYLKSHRKPGQIGRPELIYRLTEKGHEVFPSHANELALGLLGAARELFGPAAPNKLVFLYFREKEKQYAARIRGDDPLERAKWFIREREREGFVCTIESPGPNAPFRIIERHSPVADVMKFCPESTRMEVDMIERLLRASTRLVPVRSASKSHHAKEFIVAPSPAMSACNPRPESISFELHE